MALKIKVPDLNGVDAAYHSLYTQQGDGSYLLTGVEGMKTQEDVDRLSQALNAERGAHRETKKTYAPLLATGMELTDIIALVDRKDELAALENGSKDVAALVDAKVKTVTGPLERELGQLRTQVAERDTQLADFQSREKTRTIHEAIRSAANSSQGFLKHAVDDALMLGTSQFEVQEDGSVLTKDGYRADVWLADLQQKRPHWWEGSTGGGAGGSGNQGDAGNPWLKANWSLSKQGEAYRQNPEKARQLAQAAGVAIGATAPAK